MNIITSPVNPTRWNMQDAVVEYNGVEYLFWAEYDEIDDSFTLEFSTKQPDNDFDFEGLEGTIRNHMLDTIYGKDWDK